MRPKQLFAPLSLVLLLTGTACSSGANDPALEDIGAQDDDSNAAITTQDNEPTSEPTPEPTPTPPPINLGDLGVPTIEGDSNDEVRTFAALLEEMVVFGLIDLNEKLQSGEQFSDAESDCLGSFEPAVGDALLSIECNTGSVPLVNGVFSLFLLEAGVAQTAACNDGLLALDGSACRLTKADILIPVEWTSPDNGLPTPYPNGMVEFNLSPDSLDINSLPNSVTANFDCSFNFATGNATSGTSNENCASALDGLARRVQVWLDRRTSQLR